MASKRSVRIALLVLVLVSALLLANSYRTSHVEARSDVLQQQTDLSADSREPLVGPRPNITVISTQPTPWIQSETNTSQGSLIAFDRDGRLLYYNNTIEGYGDVDPSPHGRTTVVYVAYEHLTKAECPATTACSRSVIERANLTTGEVTRLYSHVNAGIDNQRWHDVDRVGPDRFLVGDIGDDRVFILNVSTGITTWSWDAQDHFPLEGGGKYPDDWTHLNDVERLDDGRIMVSLRNQDQVVFIDRRTGVVDEWTLGAEDAHRIIYEQHNPDYIPPENGGPAVIVADSQNDRAVEYQRVDGEWERSWAWRDARMQWPRDADRLPNGHTLIADTASNRVLEIDRSGEVVWSVAIAKPYEVERLGTGDESAGGPSARSIDLGSRRAEANGSPSSGGGEDRRAGGSSTGFSRQVFFLVKDVVPGPIVNGLLFLAPPWMDVGDLFPLIGLFGGGVAWLVLEYRWSGYRLSVRSPFVVSRRE